MKRFKPFQIIAFVFALLIAAGVFTIIQMSNSNCGCAGAGYAMQILLSLFCGFVAFVLLMLILHTR